MSGWVQIFGWQKYHYFTQGKALCGRGVVPVLFDAFKRPRPERRCSDCQRKHACR